MKALREYDVVRVERLLTSGRAFTGTDGVCRGPRVGDKATICHVYDPSDPSALVAVEMVDKEGKTVWLADFAREELEFVSRSSN